MESNITFKKAFFGGFEREDVMNYIAAVTDEFYKYKKETVHKVEEMKSKIAELEKAYNSLLDENSILKDDISKLTNGEVIPVRTSQPDIKMLIEGLTESMNVLISVLSAEEQVSVTHNVEVRNAAPAVPAEQPPVIQPAEDPEPVSEPELPVFEEESTEVKEAAAQEPVNDEAPISDPEPSDDFSIDDLISRYS